MDAPCGIFRQRVGDGLSSERFGCKLGIFVPEFLRDFRVEHVKRRLPRFPRVGRLRRQAPGLCGSQRNRPSAFERFTLGLGQLKGFLLPAHDARRTHGAAP